MIQEISYIASFASASPAFKNPGINSENIKLCQIFSSHPLTLENICRLSKKVFINAGDFIRNPLQIYNFLVFFSPWP